MKNCSWTHLLVWVTGQNRAVSDQNSSGDKPETCSTQVNAGGVNIMTLWAKLDWWFLTWWVWLPSYGLPRRSPPQPRNGCSWFAALGCQSQLYTWDKVDKPAAVKTKSGLQQIPHTQLNVSRRGRFCQPAWRSWWLIFYRIKDQSQTFILNYINDFQITALLRIPLLNHHFNRNMIDSEGSLHPDTHTHTHALKPIIGNNDAHKSSSITSDTHTWVPAALEGHTHNYDRW